MSVADTDDHPLAPHDRLDGENQLDLQTIPDSFGRGDRAEKKKSNKQDDDNTSDAKQSDKNGRNGKDNSEKEESKTEDGKDNQKDKKPFWKRPRLLAAIIGVALLLTIVGVVWWLLTRNYESTDDAFIDGHIVQVAPRVAGRVLSLNVDDNEFVHADTVVINIDPAPFQAEYDNAKAAVDQAQAKVKQAEADVLVEQANAEQADADVQAALATEENAKSDYQRYVALATPARSQQQFDSSTANYKNAMAQRLAAQKKADSALAEVESAQTSVKAALASVESAEAQLEQAALEMQYVDVTAGQDGFVTRRSVEQGNYVQVGQELMTIVPRDVWVTANFKETQLRYMRPNQPVWITIDAYPDHQYKAHVQSLQTGTGAVFSTLPPENATGNFVKIVQRVPVKIVFDDRLDRIFAPGESVEPSVDISSGRR